jgi:hypothetical protein
MSSAETYEEFRDKRGVISREKSQTKRDIGDIPPIENIRRRERCRKSLQLFCETYNPEAFSLAWSADLLGAIARIEEAAWYGALYAFAMPRGAGKTVLCRMAALWSVSYALRRYVFLIGANAKKAEDTLQAIKLFIRFLPLYGADFPEIAYPVKKLGGIAHRAQGQICNGESTLIEWSKDQIVMPTVPTPPNWPKLWPKRGDGKAPTSGGVLSSSGLTGDGIRGSLLTLTTGESVRPDLVLLDDPQTPESARSPSQNVVREELISADVLGMAGPGKTISAVMPCTVIQHDDMVDRILDTKKHPLWRGERTRMLRTMPADMAAWEPYFELYTDDAQRKPPDFTESRAYYLAHQEDLERGAEASWPARKLPDETSAVQHAMHLYIRDPRAFMAEYQNEPLVARTDDSMLTAEQIAGKVNGLPRGKVPLWATRLTAFIDVGQDLLFWTVGAWDDDFTGHILDYGTFPEQKRAYFLVREANPKLGLVAGVDGVEAVIYKGLSLLTADLLGRSWVREDGQAFRIERLLVDAGKWTETIKQWCRQSGRGEVRYSFGRYFGAAATPINDFKRAPGQRKGLHWLMKDHVLFDTNFWKSFLHARLAVAQPNKGCLTLWGDTAAVHRMFSEHLTAEFRERVEAKGREVDEWKLIVGRENHWLDCCVGAAVAASVQGSKLAEGGGPTQRPRPRVSFAEQQRLARGRRGTTLDR